MSNFSKIVIIVLVILSFFFIKEKYGDSIVNIYEKVKNPNIDEVILPEKFPEEKESIDVKDPVRMNVPIEKETVSIYFLTLDSEDNGIYKKVQRELPSSQDKLEYAIKELLKGPNIIEKTSGTYSEIPSATKLLGVKQIKNKTIIDLSSDFQYGGGTDSIYSRMMQIIKTSLENSKGQKIYLYLDGEQVNIIGGEGIMISQPLSEKSLEI